MPLMCKSRQSPLFAGKHGSVEMKRINERVTTDPNWMPTRYFASSTLHLAFHELSAEFIVSLVPQLICAVKVIRIFGC